jgi:NAD(P)H-dependent flavin oxidoreductase YrpB (nitropropane dioxygenase family)
VIHAEGLFGARLPLWQAPTGSVAGPELASEVAAAGGMGAMALTWTAPETAADHVRQVRARTDRPFQVNFALAFEPAALPAALEAGAPIVSFSWGDPLPYLPGVRAAGARWGVHSVRIVKARSAAQSLAETRQDPRREQKKTGAENPGCAEDREGLCPAIRDNRPAPRRRG